MYGKYIIETYNERNGRRGNNERII